MNHVVRWGVEGTEMFGVFFTEKSIPGSTVIKHVKAESGRQNIGLDQLKKSLAAQAQVKGAQAIANFSYKQVATVFSFSDIRWTAEGDLVRVEHLAQPARSAPPPPPPTVPAGWYPNPTGPGQRYWDGQQWTEHTAP